MALWSARFSKQIDQRTHDFNSSISVDMRMYKEDIQASIVHVTMLEKQGIIDRKSFLKIKQGLLDIKSDIETGKIEIDQTKEDIHMYIEQLLTQRIGDAGKKLHTARSRNDQVAVDMKLYIFEKISIIRKELLSLVETICNIAEKNIAVIMPGYTHLQKAQPILYSHYVLAYANMFKRDIMRLDSTVKIANTCPLGAGALAGVAYDIDRYFSSSELSFESPQSNSIDAVSDRDYVIQLASDISIIIMHLSRFSEEIIIHASNEFSFINLDDAFSTGSSIMPQKKNPDIAELVRGKSGRCYGNLIALLTMMKGLPLAYNKDMQEDKELIFDSIDTIVDCIIIFREMISTMIVNEKNMEKSCESGYINATDLADYLVKKGIAFRDAYTIVGKIVADCVEKNVNLSEISMSKFKKYSSKIEEDIYDEINMNACVARRESLGGSALSSVRFQLMEMRDYIKDETI